MWRRIRNWWKDKALLWFMQGLIGILRGVLRVKEAFALPEKQAKYRAFREKMEAAERDKNAALACIDDMSSSDPAKREAAFDAHDAFTHKYGGNANDAAWQDIRAKMRATETHRAALQQIQTEYAGDAAGEIAAYRAYVDAHPDNDLAISYLIGVYRRIGDFDAAIALCHEKIAASEGAKDGFSKEIGVWTEHLLLASLLTEKGDARDAVYLLEKLIATPTVQTELLLASTYFALGDAYQKDDNQSAAKTAWKEAVKRDTTGIYKKEMAKRLHGEV